MRFCAFLPLLMLLGSSPAVFADNLPYGNVGNVAPTVGLTATSTGTLTGYFYSASAGGTDYLRLFDATSGYTSQFLFDNHASTPGQEVSFGPVTAGDTLVFELVNSDVETTEDFTYFGPSAPFDPNAQVNNFLLTSDPAYSVDGINHAYVTSFSGDAALGIPSGTFVGMEDLPLQFSDLDYNDDAFVFTDVSATVTPEPGSVVLLATGALGLAATFRRRIRLS